jgi:DNA-directed RNA polymerase specialized sigma24 family protein
MPADLLAVLAAVYCDGLSERQAAARLNLTRHQVRTRLAAAHRYIRNNRNSATNRPKAVHSR